MEQGMRDLSISTVRSPSELRAFIEFPWEVYKQNPHWVPPLLSERTSFHDPDQNPFFDHATVQYFLARRDGKLVGTIAAFTNQAYNDFQQTNVGFFGFFEVLEDLEAAAKLLETAEAWARNAGHDVLLGPAQFTTNDEVGLLVSGFDDPPRILMTYNPPRYMDYLESAGFQKAMDLWAYAASVDEFVRNTPVKLLRVVEKVKARRKLNLRNINMKEFDVEVERFKRVYNKSWARNWGFVPMKDVEIDHLAENLKPIIDPALVFMVEFEDEVIGVSLSLPDLNQPLLKAYPRPNVPEAWTMLKLLWHWRVRREVDWLRVFALGVHPDFRGVGVDAMMYLETARAAISRGFRWAEMSWILEDNDMMNRTIRLLGGEVYKTHRMYEKALT
jgi:GNAT superfamily N-acetyltransferase